MKPQNIQNSNVQQLISPEKHQRGGVTSVSVEFCTVTVYHLKSQSVNCCSRVFNLYVSSNRLYIKTWEKTVKMIYNLQYCY